MAEPIIKVHSQANFSLTYLTVRELRFILLQHPSLIDSKMNLDNEAL